MIIGNFESFSMQFESLVAWEGKKRCKFCYLLLLLSNISASDVEYPLSYGKELCFNFNFRFYTSLNSVF